MPKQTKINGLQNKLRQEDYIVHNWYRFVLSYPPHLVKYLLDKFYAGPGTVVLDPFCGTGTTLVECKRNGIESVGIEANPMAAFASRVKVDWNMDSSDFLKTCKNIAEIAIAELGKYGISDEPLPLFSNKNTLKPKLKSLPQSSSKLLLENSISPLPLHKILLLLEIIESNKSIYHDLQRLAVAKTLVNGAGNLHFGPEVGVGRAKEDAPVISIWMNNVKTMADDLAALKTTTGANSTVYYADSRTMLGTLKANSIGAVITSPPYPNEKDYTRTTRLESVLLGFLKDREDLRALKKNLIRSNTRNVYKDDDDDHLIEGNENIKRIAQDIEKRRIDLGKTSGFERMYPRVTKLYFGGMSKHFSELRSALRPGAMLAYVVGDQASYLRVMIRTGQLLAEIAESLGYKVVDLELFRTRLATATREQLREEILILQWPKG